MGINKKAIYFSIDALFASILLLGGLVALKSLYIAPNLITSDYLSRDISDAMANIKVQDLNLPYLNKLLLNGSVKKDNVSFLEKIGEMWSQNQDYELLHVLDEFHNKYLPNKEFSIYIDNILIYNTSLESETQIVSSKRMVSGITANRSRTGFIAKAVASKTVKNNTLIAMGDVISSSVKKSRGGNNHNKVEIVYTVDVPNNSSINDAYWFIEAAWTDNKFKGYINDVYIPGSSASGDTLLSGLKDYFHTGKNYAKIVYTYGHSGLEGGDDGASHVVVNYQTNRTNTLSDLNHYYFANVKSDCSIRYKKPIFISGETDKIYVNLSLNATNANLSINFEGNSYFVSKKNVENQSVMWSNTEISNVLQNFGLNYSNFTGKYVWFDIDVDTYHARENIGASREIYNSSYVYTSQKVALYQYGYIDITRFIGDYDYSDSVQGNFYKNIVWHFNNSNSSIPLSLNSQFAWLYFTGTTPSQIVKSNSNTLYSSPPSSLIKEFSRFGYTGDYIISGENNFSLHFGDGYGVNPFNSFVDFSYFIKNMVPYGNTFDSEDSALLDAEQRLNDTLGSDVNALVIDTNVLGVGHVPSLWGPLLVEVRSWK